MEQYDQIVKFEKKVAMEDLQYRRGSLMDRMNVELIRLNRELTQKQAEYDTFYSRANPSWLRRIRKIFKKPSSGCEADDDLPDYKAWLIYVIMLLQIGMWATCLGLFGIEGIADIRLDPLMKVRHGVVTFEGRETVEHWVRPNLWIGLSPDLLIKMGAVYAPCMREDVDIALQYSLEGYMSDPVLGCCQVAVRGPAGTTTQEQCEALTAGVGEWLELVPCSERTSQNEVPHVMWPCCYGLKGACMLTTRDHCAFMQGVYHADTAEHCTQVNCLSETCGMGGLLASDTLPYLPAKPAQHWRLFIAPFLHQGALYLLPVLILEGIIGHQLETVAGPVRLVIIFYMSAVFSHMMAAAFEPYLPHSGAGGFAFALLGVGLVELMQSWTLVQKPGRQVLKYVALLLLSLVTGTLPNVSNIEMLTGLLYGMLLAILLLPYVTFGVWSTHRRRVLFGVSLIVLVTLATFTWYLFEHPIDQACGPCHWLNCVPYTSLMCNTTDLW